MAKNTSDTAITQAIPISIIPAAVPAVDAWVMRRTTMPARVRPTGAAA